MFNPRLDSFWFGIIQPIIFILLHHILPFSTSALEATINPNQQFGIQSSPFIYPDSLSALPPERCPKCPECFNCKIPKFECKQYGTCDEYDGQCKCPAGFGGQDCGQPVCGSLADGDRRYPRADNSTSCVCSEGWSGINCNVCESDQACAAMIPPLDANTGRPAYPASDAPTRSDRNQSDAVCYKGGFAIKNNYQMCNVTNRKILDMLPDRVPQVSFDCNINDASCRFQFWIGSVESFYCSLSDCHQSIQLGYQTQPNITQNECNKMKCKCIPGKMLCGESGSIDIGDFLKQEIKGPGKFSCSSDDQGCKFEEPAMNSLITDVFGDTYITLHCQSGECMHYTLVPGFTVPVRPDNSQLVALSIAFTGLFVVMASLLFWYYGRNRAHKYPVFKGRIRLPTGEDSRLNSDHIPADLTFSQISYSVQGTPPILHGVSGKVKAGGVMAIMGASGAGKSSLLDILAKKSKSGYVEGDIFINNKQISNDQFKNLIGYVDQEDTLMSTLTVYETVLCSAMLRLPREMSLEAKKIRTLETLEELGILHIKDSFIGKSGRRSISGGEKRRVSIGCELVTSPSILFLDEPTSGLDSFNAFNVVDSLAQLAKNYNRTVVFTIHQPQSNILKLFDQLVLLGKRGRLIYSGPFEECYSHFESIGYACPTGYNIGDYLIDLTMKHRESARGSTNSSSLGRLGGGGSSSSFPQEGPSSSASNSDGPSRPPHHLMVDETELATRKVHQTEISNGKIVQRKTSPRSFLSPGSSGSSSKSKSIIENEEEDMRLLDELTESFMKSEINKKLNKEVENVKESGELMNLDEGFESRLKLRGHLRISLWEEFLILCGRAFKNLYRNPMLMFAHYLLAIILAGICAILFHNLTLDIGGFQGRMGLFFFILSLFSFSSLSSISIFTEDRMIFMRERSNNYYRPSTYFISKMIFDLIPLRILPPFIIGIIIYYPIGLVLKFEEFWKFLMILILFNLVCASLIVWISLIFYNLNLANLFGSLIMLFNLLFGGLLINREKLPNGLRWIEDLSFFHSAFEALLINEVRYLSLKDHRYGVDIEVPSASILSLFGFRITAFWWPDITILIGMLIFFLCSAYITLVFFVHERR